MPDDKLLAKLKRVAEGTCMWIGAERAALPHSFRLEGEIVGQVARLLRAEFSPDLWVEREPLYSHSLASCPDSLRQKRADLALGPRGDGAKRGEKMRVTPEVLFEIKRFRKGNTEKSIIGKDEERLAAFKTVAPQSTRLFMLIFAEDWTPPGSCWFGRHFQPGKSPRILSPNSALRVRRRAQVRVSRNERGFYAAVCELM